MDKSSPPPLLPILRSAQQAEILTALLGDPELEISVSEVSARLEIPYASVHREVERAEETGLLVSRRVGRTRLVRANPASPYFEGLADVLVKAFGPPSLLGAALSSVDGVDEAFIYGSWAARQRGERGNRPVGDIDLLVLGAPDRDALYAAVAPVERRLGRRIQVTVREPGWVEAGSGSLHDTIVDRPLVPLTIGPLGGSDQG